GAGGGGKEPSPRNAGPQAWGRGEIVVGGRPRAVKQNATAVRMHQPEHHPQQRRLAAAALADENRGALGRDAQIAGRERRHAVVGLRHAGKLEHRRAHGQLDSRSAAAKRRTSSAGLSGSPPDWCSSETIALPTTIPSTCGASALACSGVEIPNPTARGTFDAARAAASWPGNSGASAPPAPVPPLPPPQS